LNLGELLEGSRAEQDREDAAGFEFNRVVDTPRRAAPSVG
jgi:hypothetical protein